MPLAQVFSALVNNIESIISHGGYTILFLITILEGVPVLGMAVPGHIAIVVSGFLSSLGTFKLEWVIIITAIGAILGDYIGYAIGRRYGMTFIKKLEPYFGSSEKYIERAKAILDKHTGKAMILGRFIPATRALLPFLVGANKLPAKKFWYINIIGGLIWVIVSIFLGYAFGEGYEIAAQYFGRIILISILAGILIIWGYRFINLHFHVFKKYELFTLFLNLFSLYVLGRSLQDAVSTTPFLIDFDINVSQFMADLYIRAPYLADISAWISDIGGTLILIIFTIILGLIFSWHKRWRSAAIMLFSVGSTALVVGLFKDFFLRERPLYALQVLLDDPSFPSGHASISAAFFIAAAYIISTRVHSWVKREILLVVCTLGFVSIGLSRLILNVHWASDVMAGWALGAFLATATILIVRYVGFLLRNKAA